MSLGVKPKMFVLTSFPLLFVSENMFYQFPMVLD